MAAADLGDRNRSGTPQREDRSAAMAVDPITVLRRYVDEPDVETYSDEELAERVATAANLYATARDIWIEKLSKLSALVDVSEGGSSRKMSQAYAQAREMVKFYSEMADVGSGSPTGAVLRPLTRT